MSRKSIAFYDKQTRFLRFHIPVMETDMQATERQCFQPADVSKAPDNVQFLGRSSVYTSSSYAASRGLRRPSAGRTAASPPQVAHPVPPPR